MIAAPKNTFDRGIHPEEMKHLAQSQAIETLPMPKLALIPMQQHLGAPCKMAVKPRAEVAMGDVIGEAGGFISSPVHASVSGKVGREAATTLPNGRRALCAPIKADAEQPFEGRALFDEIFGGEWPTGGIADMEPKEISDAALQAGLVGMGGAAFPTHVKLLRTDKKPSDTLIINGCECEPYLTADYRLMMEAPAPIIAGALVAKHACGAKKVIICLEDDTPEAADSLRKAAGNADIEVRLLKTKYPQGGEKQLAIAVTGRAIPTGGLPLDIGVVAMNVGTTAALARAVLRKKPVTHRIISVTGAGVRSPKNVLAPIGASYGDLLEFCGGLTDNAARMISGGPMMGFAFSDLSTPITKGTSGLTVLTAQDLQKSEETACVRCGRCVGACPLNLVPTKLALASRAKNPDVARRHHMNACMECGSCAYVCPASLPLVQLMRQGKIMLRNQA